MKNKILITLIFISSIGFAQDSKTYKVGAQAWMIKDQKQTEIPIGYSTEFGGYTCWAEDRLNNFKYGVGIYCKSSRSRDIFLTQALCDKRTPGDEMVSNMMIIGKEVVSLNVECRTTNKEHNK